MSQIPKKERVQIVTLVDHAANIYLPTFLPFTPTHGRASATLHATHSIWQTVTVTLNNNSELLTLTEPNDDPNLVPPNAYFPSTVKLSDGSPVAFQKTAKWSELSWYNPQGSYVLYSSKIANGVTTPLLGPDLSEQQLIKIAESVK